MLTQKQVDDLLNASREADEGPTQLVRRVEAAAAAAERERITIHMADCFESLARRFAGDAKLSAELWKTVATLKA